MNRIMTFWKTENAAKKIRLIMLFVMVLALIPMLWMARYDYMGADDYSYSIIMRHAWVETHSLPAVGKAFFEQFVKSYTTWQGSYTCIILSSLQPGVFNEHFYGIGAVILILFLVFSAFYSCRVLVGDLLGHREAADIAACSIVILCTQIPPHTMQAFYWWNGAVNYLPFFCLLMILTARYARMLADDTCSIRDGIVTALLAFIGAGGNYVVTLVIVEEIVLFFVLDILLCKKTRLPAFLIMLVTFAGLALNLLSPGNFVRMGSYEETPLGAVESIFLSIRYGFAFCSENVTILFILFMLIPLPFLLAGDYGRIGEKIRKIPSALFVMALFLLLASSFAPTMMIEHSEGPRRAQNARFFIFVFYMLLTEIFFAAKFMVAVSADPEGGPAFDKIKGAFREHGLKAFYISIACLLAVMLGYYTLPRENRDMISSISGLRSILVGEAKAYGQEMEERYEIFHNDEKDVTVPMIRNHPKLVYFSEFDMDPSDEDWKNRDMAKYYYKNSISAE